jgi:DNA excision repair protein ERCC-2
MLDEFFSNDEFGVMFTSTRGTITEGVDYDGSKLHCCAVIGIPLIDTRPDRIDAIKYAYAKKVPEKDGFNTAIKIPAVRKARQAIGRVIRGKSEVGVRILVDGRYGSAEWDGAKEYLSQGEQDEFRTVPPKELEDQLDEFWQDRSIKAKNSDKPNTLNVEDTTQNDDGDSKNNTSDGERTTGNGSSTTEKLYFGEGSTLSGWVEFELDVIESDLLPIIEEGKVKNAEEHETIKMNGTKDVGLNGWVDVRQEVVRNDLDPLAKENKIE